MKKKLLVYLTPAEQVIFDYLFQNAKGVELEGGKTVIRVGLANGKFTKLLNNVNSVIGDEADDFDDEDFACRVIKGFATAGMIRKEADLPGCVQGVTFSLLMKRNELIVKSIHQRETVEVQPPVFMAIDGTRFIQRDSIAKMIRACLGEDLHKYSVDAIRKILTKKLNLFSFCSR